MANDASTELQIIIRAQIEQAQQALSAIGDAADKMAAEFQASGASSSVSIDSVKRSIDELKADMQTIRDSVVAINVRDDEAKAEISAFKADVDSIPSEKTVRVNVNEEGAGGGAGASAEGGIGMLGNAIIAALPSISPLLASASAATIGLAGAFSAATAGVAGFAAVAEPNLKTVFAAVSDGTASLKGLNSAQQAAAESLASFEKFYQSFAAQFQTPVLTDFTNALEMLQTLLTDMRPVIEAGANSIGDLMNSMNKGLQSTQMQTFFTWLAQQAGPAIKSFGDAAGNVFKGLASLMMAFTPVIQPIENGLDGLTASFAKWAAGLSNTQGFQTFLSYVRTEGPQVMSLIGQLGSLLVKLLSDMAPVGAVVLRVALDITTLANNFAGAHPQIVTMAAAVISAVGAFKLITPAITGTVSAAKTLIGLPGQIVNGFNTLGTATGSVINFTSRLIEAGTAAVTTGAQIVGSFVASTAEAIASAARATASFAIEAAEYAVVGGAVAALKVAEIAQTAAETAMSAGAAVATAATTALGVAMDVALGPIGLVIAAAAALVAGLILLVTHWKTVISWLQQAWNWFKNLGTGVQAVIALINPFIGIPALIIAHWSSISSFFQGVVSDIEGEFTHLISEAESWGENLVNMFAQGISNAIGAVTSAVSNVAGKVASFLGFHSPTEEGPASDSDTWAPNFIKMFAGGLEDGIPTIQGELNRVMVPPNMSSMATTAGQSFGSKFGQSAANGIAQSFTSHTTVQINAPVYGVDDLNAVIESSFDQHMSNFITQLGQTARAMGAAG